MVNKISLVFQKSKILSKIEWINIDVAITLLQIIPWLIFEGTGQKDVVLSTIHCIIIYTQLYQKKVNDCHLLLYNTNLTEKYKEN